jgi:hypothetical protein
VGASTAKGGRGIIPIVAPTSCAIEAILRKTVVAVLKTASEEQREHDRMLEQLRSADVPHVAIDLNGPENLAVELFKWEIATALACVQLQSNPFDDPEIRESRAKTSQILDRITAGQHVPATTVRVKESDVELFAERETRQQISTLNMTEALRSFLALRSPDGYFALIPFFGLNPRADAMHQTIRNRLESALGIPVFVAPAPRYLHGLAQACKEGPPGGLFILLTGNPASDIAVPGAGYTFGQLQLAMALAEFDSLGRNERPVIRLHLARGAEPGLIQLESILTNALGK